MISQRSARLELEQERIRTEYRRREAEVPADRYSPWQPAENFIIAERKAAAALELERLGKFPAAGNPCLEIGYGRLGWLADLLSWGLLESDLHGIELDGTRGMIAQQALPHADLRIGDAASLPWPDSTFKVIVASTVFSSILDNEVQEILANELVRVLAPGGAIIWYDMFRDNPRNKGIAGIGRSRIGKLFPSLQITTRSVTLLPPLARLVVPRSKTIASLLSSIPLLRTHLLGILVKDRD